MSHPEKIPFAPLKWAMLAVFGGALVTALLMLASPAHAAASVSITKQLVGGSPSLTQASATTYDAGSQQTWQYVITNTGDQTLRNAVVTDDQGVPVSGCPAVLTAGQSGVCTGSGTIGSGLYGAPQSAPAFATRTITAPNPTVGQFYSWAVPRTGDPAPTFTTTSTVPGLTLSPAGVITGIPTRPGSWSFTIVASNSVGTAPSEVIFLNNEDQPITTITTDSLPTATIGSYYSAQLASDGTSALWTVASGGMPSGLRLSTSGQITGTPSGATGNVPITFQAYNSESRVSKDFTFVIVPAPPKMTGATMANATYGTAYSQQVPGVTGSGLTYSITSGSLPPGFSMSSSGLITGSSTVPWTATNGTRGTFTVQTTNAGGTASASYNFLAYPAPPPSTFTGTYAFTASAGSVAVTSTSQFCATPVPNPMITVSQYTVTAGTAGAQLVNKLTFVPSCTFGITGVTKKGTFSWTLTQSNITATKTFTVQVTLN